MPSTSTLYARLMRLHESSYLTLLSIVQGVATAFLGASIPSHFVVGEWLLFVATFAFLVLVWAEYNMGVASLCWIPTFRDALIPFALCMTEILLSKSLAQPRRWFLGASMFCVIGFFAFLNMYTRARRYPENEEVLQALGWWKAAGEYFCLLAAVIFLGVAFRESKGTSGPVIAVAVVALFAIRTQCAWRRIVRYAKIGVTRSSSEN
jgi:uncharacterized membrane protein YwaF